MYSEDMKLFWDNQSHKRDIVFEFSHFGSLASYQDYLSTSLDEVDIALIPSDWFVGSTSGWQHHTLDPTLYTTVSASWNGLLDHKQ